MMTASSTIQSERAQRPRQTCFPHHLPESYQKTCRRLLLVFWAIMLLLCLTSPAACGQPSPRFRFGFSTSTFGDVNENDIIASVRIWAQAIAKEFGISTDPQPVLFRSVDEIKTALTRKTVDCVNLSTNEFAALRGLLAEDKIVVAVVSDSITEQYVLLVHRRSGIEKLEDLKGRRLDMLRYSLAPIWLDTLLAREGLDSAADFFTQIVSTEKVGKAVLSVFFRQIDACVVTRKAFDTMVELNPQTDQQLKVLATSPAVVPTVFCFRADYTSPILDHIETGIKNWHLSPAGRQVLTIFKMDRLAIAPASCLDSSMKLIAEYERLTGNKINAQARKVLTTTAEAKQ